jgi:hypothetical protein
LCLHVIGQEVLDIQSSITGRGENSLPITVCENFGDKPISDWLVKKVKEFVLDKYGLDVEVSYKAELSGAGSVEFAKD